MGNFLLYPSRVSVIVSTLILSCSQRQFGLNVKGDFQQVSLHRTFPSRNTISDACRGYNKKHTPQFVKPFILGHGKNEVIIRGETCDV